MAGRLSAGAPSALLASILIAWLVWAPGSAAAFGTILGGGQNREHERITRAALACPGGTSSTGACFEARSLDRLAGHDREFGGVGAPDSDELRIFSAHCDDADFLEAGYPHTREQATATLVECVDHLRVRFDETVDGAPNLLDDAGRIDPAEVDLEPECRFFEVAEKRAKCASLEGIGRVLHGVQDFYAHSNWADEADPSRAIGPENPPGLDRPGPSPVLDFRSDTPPSVPEDLTTGCFVVRDEVHGVGECTGRVTHAALNKDRGLIDPVSGVATDPTTPRGMVEENFAKAVTGAIEETRRQWRDVRAELVDRYGEEKAAAMVCALTRDDPATACSDTEALVDQVREDTDDVSEGGSAAILPIVLVGLGLGAVALVVRRRRRT
jgi:hypothetical protein